MLNIFKKNTEQVTSNETVQSGEQENIGNENLANENEKKKVHGQDGVCCGSCGGE